LDLFKMFGKKQEKSKNIAKERLKLVLVHDRSDLSPRFLDMIKTDIIRVITEYADIDEEGLDIKMTDRKEMVIQDPCPPWLPIFQSLR